jgi:hypothetical protein
MEFHILSSIISLVNVIKLRIKYGCYVGAMLFHTGHTQKNGADTGHTHKNGAVSKVIKTFISHPIWAQHTLPAAGTF